MPDGWAWSRLEPIASLITDYVANGSFASLKANVRTYKEKNYALFVRTVDFANNFKGDLSYIDKESYDFLEKSKLYGGELMLSNIGASIGKVFKVPHLDTPMSLAPNAIILRFFNDITCDYFEYVFKSFVGQNYLQFLSGGAAMPKFNKTDLRAMIVPVPPIKEQERIVESVKNTFIGIDDLDISYSGLANTIQSVKSKILDLAIRGKLVPQDPNDEPASVLLERIRAEKEELIKQGKIKRNKKESVIFKGDDNSYYQDLPNCWSVCKLCEISYFERGITFPASAKETVPTDRNIACARTANVQDLFDISNLIYVDRSFMKDNPDKLLKVNDIIVSTANSLELVGKSCIVEKLLEKMTFGGFVTVVRGIGINHKYIHMCLKNKFLKGEFSYKSTQTTNIANISTKDLAETIIYLPPLAEQRRIVNAVETLFAQIDKIAEQIS